MKKRDIDLYQSRSITIALIISGAVVALIGAALLHDAKSLGIGMAVTGACLIFGAAIFDMIFSVCPYCGEYIDLRTHGDYCPHCGKKVRERWHSAAEDIYIEEVSLYGEVIDDLISMSEDWEKEGSCRGYRKNEYSDLEGNRVFLAKEKGNTAGYLFGHVEEAKNSSSVVPEGTPYFEVEEIYVKPKYRSKGIGRALFCFAEEMLKDEVDWVMLSTATKNWKSVFHFYIDELGMDFWNARLFKKIERE